MRQAKVIPFKALFGYLCQPIERLGYLFISLLGLEVSSYDVDVDNNMRNEQDWDFSAITTINLEVTIKFDASLSITSERSVASTYCVIEPADFFWLGSALSVSKCSGIGPGPLSASAIHQCELHAYQNGRP